MCNENWAENRLKIKRIEISELKRLGQTRRKVLHFAMVPSIYLLIIIYGINELHLFQCSRFNGLYRYMHFFRLKKAKKSIKQIINIIWNTRVIHIRGRLSVMRVNVSSILKIIMLKQSTPQHSIQPGVHICSTLGNSLDSTHLLLL